MMATDGNCPECGSSEIFARGGINARGGYGPDLLPGTAKLFARGKMRALVCKGCGLIRFYAERETLSRINPERGWERVR
jgi:predicted nucleic-acid-binding Zn-ribbon protein